MGFGRNLVIRELLLGGARLFRQTMVGVEKCFLQPLADPLIPARPAVGDCPYLSVADKPIQNYSNGSHWIAVILKRS